MCGTGNRFPSPKSSGIPTEARPPKTDGNSERNNFPLSLCATSLSPPRLAGPGPPKPPPSPPAVDLESITADGIAAVWSSWAAAGDEDADKGAAPGEEDKLVFFLESCCSASLVNLGAQIRLLRTSSFVFSWPG